MSKFKSAGNLITMAASFLPLAACGNHQPDIDRTNACIHSVADEKSAPPPEIEIFFSQQVVVLRSSISGLSRYDFRHKTLSQNGGSERAFSSLSTKTIATAQLIQKCVF